MYLKKYNLKGKYALVTGAGKGLGKACAIALAEAGANLVIISRTQKDLNEVYLSEIKADPFFHDFPLVKQARLSVMPVTLKQWKKLINMSEKNERI